MPSWVKADNPVTRTTAAFSALLAVLLLAASTPAVATVYNSRNPDNAENIANPWTEDLANDVGIAERLNSPVPQDLELIDEDGQAVRLGTFFEDGRVVIINLGYSRCPSICILMRDELTGKIAQIGPVLGEDYVVLNISIDPEETPEVSSQMRDQVFAELAEQGLDADRDGWRFLTGQQEAITELTAALGYRYIYIDPQNEYGHPGVLVLADGKGVIKRYMSGTSYTPRALELSIVETSNGVAGDVWDRVFLTCFEWDPEANNYAATAKFLMMTGGVVILVVLGGLVLFGFAYEKRRRQMLEARPESMGGAEPA